MAYPALELIEVNLELGRGMAEHNHWFSQLKMKIIERIAPPLTALNEADKKEPKKSEETKH